MGVAIFPFHTPETEAVESSTEDPLLVETATPGKNGLDARMTVVCAV